MCQTLIQDVIDWLFEDPDPPNRAVQFYLTSNEATITGGDNLVSYAQGELSNRDSGRAFWGSLENPVHYNWKKISGQGIQLFNDRHRAGEASQNFDSSQRDTIELAVTLSTPGPNGTLYHLGIDLALVTWGGGIISLTGFRCEEGILFAYADGSPDRNGPNNKVGYTITFKNVTRP